MKKLLFKILFVAMILVSSVNAEQMFSSNELCEEYSKNKEKYENSIEGNFDYASLLSDFNAQCDKSGLEQQIYFVENYANSFKQFIRACHSDRANINVYRNGLIKAINKKEKPENGTYFIDQSIIALSKESLIADGKDISKYRAVSGIEEETIYRLKSEYLNCSQIKKY